MLGPSESRWVPDTLYLLLGTIFLFIKSQNRKSRLFEINFNMFFPVSGIFIEKDQKHHEILPSEEARKIEEYWNIAVIGTLRRKSSSHYP